MVMCPSEAAPDMVSARTKLSCRLTFGLSCLHRSARAQRDLRGAHNVHGVHVPLQLLDFLLPVLDQLFAQQRDVVRRRVCGTAGCRRGGVARPGAREGD